MKKSMSRIVCALLVVAMVCAMIPAALAAPVSGVTLNQNSLNLKPGDTATLVATVAPDDAYDKTLTWESNDTNVVTVSNGAVTAVGAGSATITVTSAADNTKTATCAVTVAKASLTIENPNYTVPAVAIGTDLPQLPATMQAKGEGANAATCNIAWNEADVLAYNKNVAGTYVINGIASLSAEDEAKYTLTGNAVTATIVVGNTPVITIGQPVPQDMKIKKGATNKTLQVVATAAAGDKNLTSAITYQWYKSNGIGSYVPIAGATSSVLTITDTATAGKTTYYCTMNVTDPDTQLKAASVSTTPVTVEVCDAYKVTLTTTSITPLNTSVTVGTNPVITATVQEFDEAKGDYKQALNYNTLVWSTDASAYYATIAASLANNTATLTTNAVNNTAGMTVKVTATIKDTTCAGTLDIRVVPGAASDITFALNGASAAFTKDPFANAVSAVTGGTQMKFNDYIYYTGGKTLSYVVFNTPYGGALYAAGTTTLLPSGTKCYYTPSTALRQYALEGVYFVPTTSSSTPYVTYTAYDANGGIIATGKVVIQGASADIEYDVAAGQSVRFDEDDFQKFFSEAYNRGTLSYVKFDTSYDKNLNTRTYGYLYESSDRNADTVDSRTEYCYNATSRQYDLDTIVFTAGSRTSKYTINIPFVAYGTKSNGTSAQVEGNVAITVNDGKVSSIYSIGTSFKGDLVKAMAPENVTNSQLANYYVVFGDVTNGRLYYAYDTIASAKEVTNKLSFFFSAGRNDLALSDVYFVPAAGAQTAKVTYTIYDGKSKIESGSLSFNIVQQTKSNYFNDVTESNTGKWSANAIDFMSYNSLVNGTANKSFSPSQTMTRGMLVTILYRIEGKPSVNVSNPFKDVDKNSYYYDAVLWAYKNDIVTGTSKSTFNPNGAVTREQIAAILYRYAGKPRTTGTLSGYSDRSKVSSYAETAMAWAVKEGIITGKSATTLDPAGKGTRAEVAVMLYRYLTK